MAINSAVMNAKRLATMEVALDLATDVLHFGNRKFEKELGASNKSGDTVYIDRADGGAIYDDTLDISGTPVPGTSRDTKRTAVELKVKPISAAYTMSQEELELQMKDSAFNDRLVARLGQRINSKAIDAIKGGCYASAIDCTGTGSTRGEAIIDGFFKATAEIEASKIKGEVCGVANVEALNALAAGMANHGLGTHAEPKELWAANLKSIAGINFSKVAENGLVTGVACPNATATWNVTTDDAGFHVIKTATGSNAWGTAGATVGPFKLTDIKRVDDLGSDLVEDVTIYGVVDSEESTVLNLVTPLRYDSLDPFRNCYSAPSSTTAISAVLETGAKYIKPILLWKKDDFCVAVKGLEAMKGQDSYTIPAGYGAKGILPLRGTAHSDFDTSTFNVRYDCLYGMKMAKGIAGQALYLKVQSA